MNLDFKDHPTPFEYTAGPPLKKTVLESRELEEVHERMRKWLREYKEGGNQNEKI